MDKFEFQMKLSLQLYSVEVEDELEYMRSYRRQVKTEGEYYG